jgi:glutamate-5-semialdehyde dehydrogenase
MTTDLPTIGQQAREASRTLVTITRQQKDAALHAIADVLHEQQDEILEANNGDMEAARVAGTSQALLDRMLLTPERLASIATDTRNVATLEDPVGEVFDSADLPNGLKLHKLRTPLGVVGVIYEARPNVTVDIAALCLKSGNAVILRGGSDIRQSCAAITRAINTALERVGLPAPAVQSITDPDRAVVREMLQLDKYIDMIIPRGGAGLHRFCIENATIPVITGGIGICHIYADPTADVERAIPIIVNAKTQRPSVCNALDTLLIHRDIAPTLLPRVCEALHGKGVAFRADPDALKIISNSLGASAWNVTPAKPEDFETEFMSLTLAIRILDNLDDAIDHINTHSMGHSDAILTNNRADAETFIQKVDSSAVFVNTSTRFNDGGQFGLGAEVAISTQKLHARGPMGLKELTTYKWVCESDWLPRP